MELLGLAAITIILTLGFDFVNGFHDSANSIATIVATKVLSPIAAVSMAAVFNFVGIVVGQEVAKTVGKGIIDTDIVFEHGVLLVFCAVMGALIWDLITWWFGIPTSSSHALVGGLIGAGGAVAGLDAIVWGGTLKTSSFIVISPLAGLTAAFLLMILVMWIARGFTRTLVNKWFRKLQLGSSAFYSFTHGTNDAQKGMGVITLILLINAPGASGSSEFVVPLWVMVACHLSISLGTFFGGWRIVKTMASRITKLDPYQGFCAETGGAIMLFATAKLGIPVSTTHTISGGIMGVGATRRLSAVRWGVGRKIVMAWILTIPASATIAGALFLILLGLGF
ncbi:MAG: inorganic phosphate transporter [Thermoplasmatota archaeon]|nr:inorganic phosphate transporter [Candidatus Thermoplasmatota archaeon]MBU1915027.1 inorganic phosphate transporter [Candidatus Thermoplasmatota archaeon]